MKDILLVLTGRKPLLLGVCGRDWSLGVAGREPPILGELGRVSPFCDSLVAACFTANIRCNISAITLACYIMEVCYVMDNINMQVRNI